jgi:hypothetical protein
MSIVIGGGRPRPWHRGLDDPVKAFTEAPARVNDLTGCII